MARKQISIIFFSLFCSSYPVPKPGPGGNPRCAANHWRCEL